MQLIEAKQAANELATESVEQLKARIAKGISLSVEGMRQAAYAWRELERRGVDLSDLRTGLAKYIPSIAAGRLAAEAVVAFAGSPIILRSIQDMPMDQQLKLANGEPVPVAIGDDGEELMPLIRIPPAHLGRVLRDGQLLPPAMQRMAIRQRQSSKPKADDRHYKVTVDRQARLLKVGRMNVPLEEVIAAFASSTGPLANLEDESGNAVATATCKLTHDEKGRLKAACKAFNVTEPELVRRAVLMLLA